MVFDNFVFNYTHAGFFNRHFSQRNPRIIGGQSYRGKNFINLFLRIGGKNFPERF